MNLSKHDPETDMEMDMTPMIDVVFLLIIFFMVITDMTQQDLEDLQLPMAVYATEDRPEPGEYRPVVNIDINGVIKIKRQKYYDPESPDDYKLLREHLSDVAKNMKRDEDNPTLPGDSLLVRADESTAFKHVQKVMEQCGYQDVKIWKLQLAVKVPEKNDE